MSSAVRTIQIPNFSFHRSSTPMPYSIGKPALNCCGGSLSTLGNMNRPVAARAAAEAAENVPHARPIQARRESSGDVSSKSRAAALAAVGAAATGRAGGVVVAWGVAAGFAPGAGVLAVAAAAGAGGEPSTAAATSSVCTAIFGAGVSRLDSLAMLPHRNWQLGKLVIYQVTNSPIHQLSDYLQGL